MTTLMPTPAADNLLEKAALAVTKLEGWDNWRRWSATMKIALDHTWEYVEGDKVSVPDATNPKYASWVIEDCNACHRIWLALSNHIQDTVILYTDRHASELFKALKGSYEPSGASAKYYTRQTYDHAKISDYNSLEDFIMALMNLAHLVNKEVQGTNGRIQERCIAMRIIYSPCVPYKPFSLKKPHSPQVPIGTSLPLNSKSCLTSAMCERLAKILGPNSMCPGC